MDINKLKRTFKKVLAELKKTGAVRVNKSDITTFFSTSSRNDNDAANKKRENALASSSQYPPTIWRTRHTGISGKRCAMTGFAC